MWLQCPLLHSAISPEYPSPVPLLLLWLTLSPATPTSTPQVSRRARLLNVFHIIQFPNDPCTSTNTDNKHGVCYSASECATAGQ